MSVETPVLGKRKERDPQDPDAHGSTLFVSNLPYTATSTDLQTLFSDIAPVRTAFVVTEQGSGVSKGVGYVSFAIKEDAQAAFEQITKDGILLDGRNLRLSWAESKPNLKDKTEVVKKEAKPRPPARPAHPKIANDPLAIRTVVISGLPAGIDSNTLWKKIRKYKGAEKQEFPLKKEHGGEDPTSASVLFSTPALAQEGINKLHAHVYKGTLLSVTLKKRLDGIVKVSVPPKKKAEDGTEAAAGASISNAAAPSAASRLIVRNLPFNATEQDLRAVFLPFGPIYSIHIPQGPEKKNKDGDTAASARPRTKGFAFVWMLSRPDAERAIAGCNGKVVRAGMAEGIAQDKQKRKKLLREEKKGKKAAPKVEGDEGAEDEVAVVEVKDDKWATERTIAVDWALSKEKWEEEKAKVQEPEDVEMADVDAESDASESGNDDEDDGHVGVHEDGSSDDVSSDDDDAEDDSDGHEPTKPQLPAPETGTTLFVRNVPFTATDDELRTLFRAFGPLRYARITMDPGSGRSRGTGFACFWSKEDADKVVNQSDMLRFETTGHSDLPKKNPFILPSILTPDPSSMLAHSLVLHGRTLDIVRAVTRDEAGKLREVGEKKREKADKRNMYLLREGVVMPGTPASDALTLAEVERRTGSYNARRALLRGNPSLYISKTRLSIRQLPIFVTERLLKRLAIHAGREFDREVKQKKRTSLTPDELADAAEEDAEVAAAQAEKPSRKPAGRGTGVKQSKIVRIQERIDPVTGKGRSKGYGFLELQKHSDALRVLRWANNNSELNPLFEEWYRDELADLIKREKKLDPKERDEERIKRIQDELDKGSTHTNPTRGTLIVEFSIENVQVVQRRNTVQKERSNKDETRAPEKLKMPSKSEDRPAKKRKVDSKKPSTKEESVKPAVADSKKGSGLGSIIGRKRKERKGKN